MKFLIDAQLPRRLAIQLQQVGFEATHTLDLPTATALPINFNHAFIEGTSCCHYKGLRFCSIVSAKTRALELLLVSTGNINNDQLMSLFRANIKQLADAFGGFDFIELNRTSLICHL